MSYLPYEHNFIDEISNIKNFLVIVAMESEENALIKGHSYENLTVGNRKLIPLKKKKNNDVNILISRSGIGIGKAAILTYQILETLPVDAILLMGVGGALDESLNVGDTVISRQVIQHDSVSTTDEGKLFIAPGELTLSAPIDEQVDPFMKCDEKLTCPHF